MATELNKELVRETTIEIDRKKILITLTPDQKIQLKFKQRKSEVFEMDIEDLFIQLSGDNKKKEALEIVHDNPKEEHIPMISLYDFRSKYLTSGNKEIPYEVKMKLESLTAGLIREFKESQKRKKKK